MKKAILGLVICLIMIFPLFLGGCNKEFNPSITLTNEQQVIYDEVETYADSCKDTETKESTLYQIKLDIQQSPNDKLELELSIGKLKLDKLILKDKLDSDIAQKEMVASNNKFNYQTKRDSIRNIYQGTQSSYNYELSSLENKISQAYSKYLTECRNIDNSSMGTGFKEEYKRKAYQEYMNSYTLYNTQISNLKTQWQNKLEYDRYNNLYNEVDINLQRDINTLKTKYKNDCTLIDEKLESLIKQR